MDKDRFLQLLTTFADSPARIDFGKGQVIVEIHGTLIEGQVTVDAGNIIVTEGGDTMPAEQWIIERIARLPILADRILANIPSEPHFIVPRAQFLDDMTSAPTGSYKEEPNAATCAIEWISRQPAFTSRVLYLTSDAGEGKTTLIDQIARRQAEEYKAKRAKWLVVPVPLGGRPFLRLDEVILGALGNRLRFQLLYHDAFIELVRMGALVLALDGFEEMFVEGPSGDAVSALGNLMGTLRSEGTVLIAARKAYFEYKSLETQAKLFDSLRNVCVDFAQIRLERWNRAQFLLYATARGVKRGDEVYEHLSARLGRTDHPILTRAVLVKHLMDLLEFAPDPVALVDGMSIEKEDYYRSFVESIIAREATKWIDKSGEPYRQLLSTADHFRLLSDVAIEMWESESEQLPADILDLVAGGFSESQRKSGQVAKQTMERLKQHALIVQSPGARSMFSFDHPEFFHFFFGEGLAQMLIEKRDSDLRRTLRKGMVPPFSARAAFNLLRRFGIDLREALHRLNAICEAESGFSFIRENCGAMGIWFAERICRDGSQGTISLNRMVLGSDSLSGRQLRNVHFKECFFQPTSLDATVLDTCIFERCEFDQIEITKSANVKESRLVDCEFTSVVIGEGDDPTTEIHSIYDPNAIVSALRSAGFTVPQDAAAASAAPAPKARDPELDMCERVFRAFRRSTGLAENVVRQRLGKSANEFFRDILPRLQEHGIMTEVPHHGSGTQKRFGLGISLDRVNDALERCMGDFSRFCEICGGS